MEEENIGCQVSVFEIMGNGGFLHQVGVLGADVRSGLKVVGNVLRGVARGKSMTRP